MVFGRLASQVASMLRGMHKPTFTPNCDCGDYIIVVN
ncbi:MAG: uL13 family ribosomal protein, partial [Oscillospiraceae bacterium]|nr:uL13 family ribosomal protein [Oscillospiraceae bacterium]